MNCLPISDHVGGADPFQPIEFDLNFVARKLRIWETSVAPIGVSGFNRHLLLMPGHPGKVSPEHVQYTVLGMAHACDGSATTFQDYSLQLGAPLDSRYSYGRCCARDQYYEPGLPVIEQVGKFSLALKKLRERVV